VTTGLEHKLKRLTNLLGTDEGFYILALHSFVEYYLREEKGLGDELNFPQLTWEFRKELLNEYGDSFIDGLSSLGQLGKQHHLTNMVRHSFSELDAEEARGATLLFIRFCRLAGISSAQQLSLFNDQLKVWEDKENKVEQNIVIRTLQTELGELKRRNRDLTTKLDTYRDLQKQIKGLNLELAARDLEIERVRKSTGGRNDKIDGLRRERYALQEEVNGLLKEKEAYLELQTYLDHLGRLTVYTRSRLDYERLIARLSPEQKKVVDSITFDRDYLIRGSAGTGKSLVLISAMQRALRQGRLDFYRENPILFITFTKTLVKYSRFTALLMKMEIPPVLFSTLDTLVYENLKKQGPDLTYNFSAAEDYLSLTSGVNFMTRTELAAEIDEFLIGRLISNLEYIDQNIRREGMHHPLNRDQRMIVWRIRDSFIDSMESQKRYSVNYGRYKLHELMNHKHSPSKGLQTIFIDEVQDLNPAALAAVKALTTGPLVMAGDFQQSLYMTQTPFSRAGIDIRGTTKILKTNFRNTRQILTAAEQFISENDSQVKINEKALVVSFREGPPVELFREKEENDLLDSLQLRLSLFSNELGYDPENICILAPRNKHLILLEERFEQAGLPSIRINTDAFEFTNRGHLNLSTLHSCKGLDFPVILLFLPELTRLDKYSPEQTERLLRNLIFTGMTRAMDHLNIFLTENGDSILDELKMAVEIKGEL